VGPSSFYIQIRAFKATASQSVNLQVQVRRGWNAEYRREERERRKKGRKEDDGKRHKTKEEMKKAKIEM